MRRNSRLVILLIVGLVLLGLVIWVGCSAGGG
jgi:hypothetical protein